MSDEEKLNNTMFLTVLRCVTSMASGVVPIPIQEFVNQATKEVDIIKHLESMGIKAGEEELVIYKQLAEAALVFQHSVKKLLPQEMQKTIQDAWDAQVAMHEASNAPTSNEVQ